ncbi:hypothetical protein AB1Y20_009037 [Prymnesium parvum]|uniref:Major facilitator superfamily (MFS) profile domain-containing protein n=1 Tax=Prymnesium parvum TaxID=97485 RepID=A0AB34K3P3_PRYPA
MSDPPPTPIPKVVPVVLGVILCDALNQMLIFPFVPFLVRDQLGIKASAPELPLFSGILAAAYLLGQFLGSPFYGGLSEYLGRRTVLLVCVAVNTSFLLAFGFSKSYWLSLGLRFLQGASAGALTVGKLYLSDISDASNEGRVFSFIGIAMGAGFIAGPALGGLLADPALRAMLPADSALGRLVNEYPYLPPSAAGVAVSLVILCSAYLFLKESRPPKILARFSQPLLPVKGAESPASSFKSSRSSPASQNYSTALEAAMSHHASRVSLIVSEEGESLPSSPLVGRRGDGDDTARHVTAVSLALQHTLSPVASRKNLFDSSNPTSLRASPDLSGAPMASINERSTSLEEAQRKMVFWTVQVASLFFTMTNVGLTDVLPVWLSSPMIPGGGGGLALQSSAIGRLQSFTGIGNILLALFLTYRVIQWFGPVNTFIISLYANALASFCTPVVEFLPEDTPPIIATILVSAAYILVAAARNMGFATAIMLSKESAPGAPGVAIGINQSACSLGSAVGPILCGLGYTQSLWWLNTSTPFFLALGGLGLLPGVGTQILAPSWPWSSAS